MKKVLITAALLALTASTAFAAAGNIALSWSNCYQNTATLVNRNDACYVCPNTTDHRLISSFDSPVTTSQYVGVTTIIDITHGSTGIPDWWNFATGACRANAVLVGLYTGTGLLCVDPLAGANLNGPLLVVLNGNKGPNTQRWVSDNSRDNVAPLTTGSAYIAQQHTITHLKTTVDCDASDPTPVCLGCATPAVFALNEVQLYLRTPVEPGNQDIYILTNPGSYRHYSGTNNGHISIGVPTPVQNKSWGAVKALYR